MQEPVELPGRYTILKKEKMDSLCTFNQADAMDMAN